MCVMEAVAYLAGEPHTDSPECASPVITKLAVWVNDSCSDELRNQLLRDLPWRIVGTRTHEEIEQQRAFMVADWAVRFLCPIPLRRAGLTNEAARLEGLPVIDSCDAASAASKAASAAASAASKAASAAAYAASYAASAASYAASDASYAASAASYAASAASYAASAASYAARYADQEVIQRSCVDLIDRMIRLTEPQEVVPRVVAVHPSRAAAKSSQG